MHDELRQTIEGGAVVRLVELMTAGVAVADADQLGWTGQCEGYHVLGDWNHPALSINDRDVPTLLLTPSLFA